MKKIVFAGLLAISAMAIPQQQASAWVNSKFSVGLNWDMQSGGNNLLWGAWRNGQPPGPEAFGGGGGYGGGFGGGGYGGGGFGGPAYGMPTQQPYPAPAQGFGPMPQGAPMPQGRAPQAPFDASAQQPYAGIYATPFQFATYQRPTYGR